MRFRTLLSLSLLVPLAVTGVAVMGAMYVTADRHSTEMAHRLLDSVTAQAELEVFAHSEHAVGLARSLEKMGPRGLALGDSDALAMQLTELLRVNPNITWISFSNPAGDFTGAYRAADGGLRMNQSHIAGGKTALIEHTVDERGKKTVFRQEEDTKYDPRTRPFYKEAVGNKGLVWLPPYIFYEQGIPGISCAVPIYKDGGELVGVFSVDYDLNYLSELARRLAASKHSRVMVFTEEYFLLAHSALRVVQHAGGKDYGQLMTPADVTDAPTQALFSRLKEMDLRGLTPGESRSLSFTMGGNEEVACLLPVRLEAGPVMYVAMVAPKTDFAPTAWQSSGGAFGIVLMAFVAVGALAFWVAKKVSAPVTTLVHASDEIARGNLDVEVSLGEIREFRKLSQSFGNMVRGLRESVRVRASLTLAREVQRRLLPVAPPAVAGFDIAGYSAYCDETGGDYYDFIVLEKSRTLIVALGDMMGHGISSALLMATARGGLRSAVKTRETPAALLTHMNDLFFRDTGGERFMTMCLVAFDLESCAVKWASAGHDPPIIFDPRSREFREPEGGDLPLGVEPHVDYVDYQYEGSCAGQVFFVGSDGVWETYSPKGVQFGKDRLMEILARHAGRSAEEIKGEVLQALTQFRGEAPVRDDITFIVMKVMEVDAGKGAKMEGVRECREVGA